jgi:phosphoribosylformimino-5-aminoimidazole carboxamide ribotide isomerase
MQVIPVIDIKSGEAVRAVAGRRDEYRPLASPLCRSSAPEDVVAGFLSLFPFPEIYIADLDAIEGREADAALMGDLATAYPEVTFWRDAGRQSQDVIAPNLRPVVGSETLCPASPLPNLAEDLPEAALSLDFRGAEFLGPPELLASPRLWPRRVIVMTLARVGIGQGPDENALSDVKSRAGTREIFAAGGVRGPDDLELLSKLGVAGALVASALHDGSLGESDLRRLMAR